MKMNHNLAAALLTGITSGQFGYPRSCTSGNRIHTDRAPKGSAEAIARIAAADAKRQRKNLKRGRIL